MHVIRTLLLAMLVALTPLAQADNCLAWFAQFQQALARADIHDAQARALPGYPWLGIDRWLVSQQQQATTPAQQQQWIRLAALKAWQDQSLLLQRLSHSSFTRQQLDACMPVLAGQTVFGQLPQGTVPDSYATWLRVVGFYPLTAWLASGAIEQYHREMSQRFVAPVPAPVSLYVPAPMTAEVATPRSLAANPLAIPLPDEQQLQDLLNHYAPQLAIANTEPWNRPGTVQWQDGRPQVETEQATVYTWPSWTRFRGENLLQLNYQFWFSERPPQHRGDLYSGLLDGVIWRVTLQADGAVLFYDSIHPCGCYHKVYPVSPLLEEADIHGDRPVFYPRTVADARDQRITLVVEPDTHYVVRVETQVSVASETPYSLQPAESLRALRADDDRLLSLFAANGRIPSSRRRERLVLWPLGVPSAGAMRQPGQHAIAFKGRRHFDDPLLAEQLFLPAAAAGDSQP